MARRFAAVMSWLLVLSLLITGAIADEPAESPPAAPPPAEGATETPPDAAVTPAPPPPDAAAEVAPTPPTEEDYYELFKLFADTMDQVERNYVQGISRRELMEAAIHGMLSKLDPYSNYIAPDELESFRTSVESQFAGIGLQVTVENGQLKVISPIVGTPAYRTGVHAGDFITHIDGQPTQGLNVDECVRKLKGEAGTTVSITFVPAGGGEPKTAVITREVIRVETVLGDRRKPDDSWDFMFDAERKIAYVRLTSFSRNSSQELEDALQLLTAEGMRGLILDLRFNPGGLLLSAIEISDLFIEEGVIVSTRGRDGVDLEKAEAVKEGTFSGFPMAVLVNRYSASASEVLSACLQDYDRAEIIGERTFGKGRVQNVIDLEGGRSALKLTTSTYHRPSGRNIDRAEGASEADEWGVMPEEAHRIRLSDGEMLELMRVRRERDIVSFHGEGDGDGDGDEVQPVEDPVDVNDKPGPAESQFVDRQFQAALDYIGGQLAEPEPAAGG